MIVPDYVRAYDAARWWYFIHFGAPILVIFGILLLWARVAEYIEDTQTQNDEPRRHDKTLGL